MNATPTDLVAFRLPGNVVRRTFVMHTAAVLGGLVVFHMLTRQESLAALGGAASLAALVLVVGYASTARRVWLSVSPAGLSSIGYTGRRIDLTWSAPVKVSAARRSGFKGRTVAMPATGVLRFGANGIFVPAAIAATGEFASTVATWAPAAHPLRALGQHAA
jgi:hypothetical protein